VLKLTLGVKDDADAAEGEEAEAGVEVIATAAANFI
jgi:hypothetical protein